MANSSPDMKAASVAIRSSGCAFTSLTHVSRRCWRSESFFAQFLERLPAHAQVVFHLCHARASGIPFLFKLPLADFQAQLFAAEAFELEGEVFALLGEGTSLVENRCYLLLKRGFTASEFGLFFVQPRGECFGGH